MYSRVPTSIATSQVWLSHCAYAAAVAVGLGAVQVAGDGMTYSGKLESSSLVQPVTLVSSVGHDICSKVCVGLSEFLNQSNLHSQPAWSLVGKVEHWELFDTPPY